MSRYCGTWAALKCMHETVESTGVIDGHLDRVQIVTPDDFAMPEGGLNIRLNDTPSARKRGSTITSATRCSLSSAPTSSTA